MLNKIFLSFFFFAGEGESIIQIDSYLGVSICLGLRLFFSFLFVYLSVCLSVPLSFSIQHFSLCHHILVGYQGNHGRKIKAKVKKKKKIWSPQLSAASATICREEERPPRIAFRFRIRKGSKHPGYIGVTIRQRRSRFRARVVSWSWRTYFFASRELSERLFRRVGTRVSVAESGMV